VSDSTVSHDQWHIWFDRHQAALLLLARQHLSSRDEAQDAVQDGFVKFWKSREHADDPAAYLFACVRSAAIDLRRSGRSRKAREHAVATDAPQQTESPLLTGPPELDERRQMIESALTTLPAEQRETLVLKIWSGLTFAQIAAVLCISANTAASRYRYAVERLQSLLSAEVLHD
jgi:RNA polymerase sigma-70 factor (ECF subfamily)